MFLTAAGCEPGTFCGPSIEEFFPAPLLWAGTPFELNRIMLIRLLVLAFILVFFWLGVRRLRVVPGKFQAVVEGSLGFVRKNIAEEVLGKEGLRFLPILTTVFMLVVVMNITGVIPGLNIAGTSVIGLPLVLALLSFAAFIYAGFKRHGGRFITSTLFPSGVPKILYVLVAPIEFISVFVLRPITLALRLLMNMMAGHLLLVLCFLATDFLLFSAGGFFTFFGVGTLLIGLAFTLFELMVAVLQAYIFTLLTAVYIQLSLVDEH